MIESHLRVLPRHLELPAPDEVHLWRTGLDLDDAEALARRALLNDTERARADRFFRPIHGIRFTAGRSFLRALLAAYLQRSPREVRFDYGPQGKPTLVEGGVLQFNLSHSGAEALCAVSLGETVGVDIEACRPSRDLVPIARRFFSSEEQAAFLAVPAAAQIGAFYRCWTSKEALLKAWGTGLTTPLDRFTVSLDPSAPRLLHMDVPGIHHRDWYLYGVPVPEGFCATLATPAPAGALRLVYCEGVGCLKDNSRTN